MTFASARRLARTIAVMAPLVGTIGCGAEQSHEPTRPFGAHLQAYTAGTIVPSGGQAALDETVKSLYATWKTNYLKNRCGGYYVETEGGAGMDANTFVTVSEGHGYGMMLAVLMAGVEPDARAIFDGFVAIRKNLPSPYDSRLMSWGMDGQCRPPMPSENDAATDGDLDAAFALLLAEKQWSDASYGTLAHEVIDAIQRREMSPDTKLPLLGDWSTPSDLDVASYRTTRLSDHMPDHFRAFAKANKDSYWSDAVAAVYKLIDTMQTKYAPKTGLVPDFVKNTDKDPLPVPLEEANDPNYLSENLQADFDYNACRVPWRMGTDYLVTGDPAGKTILSRFNAFITDKTKNDPSMIIDGYSLDGVPHVKDAGPNGCFTGSFGVAAMVDSSNQAWLDAIWKDLAASPADTYYGDTIRLITMIVMSGNWWAP
jgi:endo-1,4-beta-D-glucanase Y